MSAPKDEPDEPGQPPVEWKTIDRVADAALADERKKIDELAAEGDAAIDAQLAAAGLGDDDVKALLEAAKDEAEGPAVAVAAAAPAPSMEKPAPAARSRTIGIAAFVAAVVVVVMMWKHDQVVAIFVHPAPSVGPSAPKHVPLPSLVAKRDANGIRALAMGDCANGFWDDCETKLDQAKQLDPAGENREDVVAARAKIAAARAVPAEVPSGPLKPGAKAP